MYCLYVLGGIGILLHSLRTYFANGIWLFQCCVDLQVLVWLFV